MNREQRLIRDRAIASAYLARLTREEIAVAHKITPRRVSQIVAEQGLTLPHHIASGRCGVFRRAGRRPLLIPEADRPLYVKARRLFGAAYARQLIGLAA